MKNVLLITAIICTTGLSAQNKGKTKKAAKPSTTVQKVGTTKAKSSIVKEKTAAREKFLVADGWVKVDEIYNKGVIQKQVKFKTDHTYTIVGAMDVKDGSRGALVINSGNRTLADNSQFIRENNVLLEINDFQPQITEANIALGLEQYMVNEAAVLLFERKKDFKRDFYKILNDRENGFANVSGLPFRKSGDQQIYSGLISLGTPQSEIKHQEKLDIYGVDIEMANPQALAFVENLMPVLKELSENGYEVEDFKNKLGNPVTKMKKNGKEVVTLMSMNGLNIISLSFYNDK